MVISCNFSYYLGNIYTYLQYGAITQSKSCTNDTHDTHMRAEDFVLTAANPDTSCIANSHTSSYQHESFTTHQSSPERWNWNLAILWRSRTEYKQHSFQEAALEQNKRQLNIVTYALKASSIHSLTAPSTSIVNPLFLLGDFGPQYIVHPVINSA